MNKTNIILIPISLFGLIAFCIFVFVVSGAFAVLMPEPPEPQIKYGEFPFRLTYELNGETKLIEDVIVCQFDGFINMGTVGKDIKWKTNLKSGKEELTLLDLSLLNIENELEQTMLELYFYYGAGAYYMGDTENPYSRKAQNFDWIDYKYLNKDGEIGYSGYKAEEAYKKYGIRLISWECAPPIENHFK